eukprot:scaffold428628_cov38-Prasinocladus_malaysianus.AAC.1
MKAQIQEQKAALWGRSFFVVMTVCLPISLRSRGSLSFSFAIADWLVWTLKLVLRGGVHAADSAAFCNSTSRLWNTLAYSE